MGHFQEDFVIGLNRSSEGCCHPCIMTRMEKICRDILMIFMSMVVLIALTLEDVHADDLHVRHAAGGQAIALELGNDYWYQSLGDKLVVIRKHGDGQVATRMLTTYPAAASCTDLIIAGRYAIYALLR